MQVLRHFVVRMTFFVMINIIFVMSTIFFVIRLIFFANKAYSKVTFCQPFYPGILGIHQLGPVIDCKIVPLLKLEVGFVV